MADFSIQFLICNIFIIGIIGILLTAKHLFKKHLSARMQYNLWFLLLGLMAVPFLPAKFSVLPEINKTASNSDIFTNKPISNGTVIHTNPLNNFTISVSRSLTPSFGLVLYIIWILGIFIMIALVIKSLVHLKTIKKSSLPVQNEDVLTLYSKCLNEMNITRDIPIYSTAFLKSPVITGVLKPCIYLPVHLISDYSIKDIRYMLLHELQHYKHFDALINHIINFARVIYWFNPVVWYALREMQCDREVACDTSVLKMLNEKDYKDYGNTLINFAEKVSSTPFPFASGISSSMKQMKKRIVNIAFFEKTSATKKLYGILSFAVTALILVGLAPILSTYASDSDKYNWDMSKEDISYKNFSSYFNGYEGCFVMYDLKNDAWTVYNPKNATLRTSPDSTYKIYNALFGLEENIITPDNSLILWDNKNYPFESWNKNQNLQSAMQNSVNWYFQSLDKQLGKTNITYYIHELGYGNQNVNGDTSSYWLESSLKISPVEQVKLLTKLYKNNLNFSPDNMNAVKNAIHISTSETGALYGKTGTGCVNNSNVNGWFIGYAETSDSTYCFAVNIKAAKNATGSKASQIALSILSDMKIGEFT